MVCPVSRIHLNGVFGFVWGIGGVNISIMISSADDPGDVQSMARPIEPGLERLSGRIIRTVGGGDKGFNTKIE